MGGHSENRPRRFERENDAGQRSGRFTASGGTRRSRARRSARRQLSSVSQFNKTAREKCGPFLFLKINFHRLSVRRRKLNFRRRARSFRRIEIRFVARKTSPLRKNAVGEQADVGVVVLNPGVIAIARYSNSILRAGKLVLQM